MLLGEHEVREKRGGRKEKERKGGKRERERGRREGMVGEKQ